MALFQDDNGDSSDNISQGDAQTEINSHFSRVTGHRLTDEEFAMREAHIKKKRQEYQAAIAAGTLVPTWGFCSILDDILREQQRSKLDKLQRLRIKFMRLVQRLKFTTGETLVQQTLHLFAVSAGRNTGQVFSLDAAKESASQLEASGRDDMNYPLNIVVLGKTGVGKSATINSIFGEARANVGAYGPATTAVKEIVGTVDGLKIRVFDTPGLKSSALEHSFNEKVLSKVIKLVEKTPPDIVLYVDRVDTQDMDDLLFMRSLYSALGPSLWQKVVVLLTHAASTPPDGPSGSPLSFEAFVSQRAMTVQQTLSQAAGMLAGYLDLSEEFVVAENHPSCEKDRDGERVLPNGRRWRPFLLLLCYKIKILSEANKVLNYQTRYESMFGSRLRGFAPECLISWLLQSRGHPKPPADQGGVDDGDSDIELDDLSDEDEDIYDSTLPFKPLGRSQVARLSAKQKEAYLEEYDYQIGRMQKKQRKEELRRKRGMQRKVGSDVNNDGYVEESDQKNGSPTGVPLPSPDNMALPLSFANLEPTSQLQTKPVLDMHGWDRDCGYSGVKLEHSVAIANQFPATIAVEITKDKKDFSILLDSSVAAKHGENISSMVGLDIQEIGPKLAYILRGETKFKNFKGNKTGLGVCMTCWGENLATGFKLVDQMVLGKHMVLGGSAGIVGYEDGFAYGTNVEVWFREADFPIGQNQSSLGLSLVKRAKDWPLEAIANFQSQFSIGRNYKIAVCASLSNALYGDITVKASSSDQLQIALLAILLFARAVFKKFWPSP